MKVLNFNKNKNKTSVFIWPIKIFFITFSLSLFFSITSESILKTNNLVMALIIIVALFLFGTVFDVIGVASAACNLEDFREFCKDKTYFNIAKYIIIHADKVSSFCCDIVGDMCGILSGSACAAIVVKLSITGNSLQIIISSLISSVVASIMVGFKAVGKVFALKNANHVVYLCSKILYNISKRLKINSNKKTH